MCEDRPFAVAGTGRILPLIRRLPEAFRSRRRLIVHIVCLLLPGRDAGLCRRAMPESGRRFYLP